VPSKAIDEFYICGKEPLGMDIIAEESWGNTGKVGLYIQSSSIRFEYRTMFDDFLGEQLTAVGDMEKSAYERGIVTLKEKGICRIPVSNNGYLEMRERDHDILINFSGYGNINFLTAHWDLESLL
jgi:hypothetical protein